MKKYNPFFAINSRTKQIKNTIGMFILTIVTEQQKFETKKIPMLVGIPIKRILAVCLWTNFLYALQHLETLHTEEYLPKFISDFSKLINKENKTTTLENYITNIDETEIDLLKQIERNNTPQKKMQKIGFDLLFKLYDNKKSNCHN